MSTYSLKLYFAGGDVSEGQLPGAIAHVAVNNATTTDAQDEIFVSHQCVGPHELEAEIARLKKELDQILVTGRRKFSDYHAGVRHALEH